MSDALSPEDRYLCVVSDYMLRHGRTAAEAKYGTKKTEHALRFLSRLGVIMK